MLHADTKILMSSGNILKISEVKVGNYVKTILGDKRVVSVETGKEFFSKFILSDGMKLTISDSQKLLTPNKECIPICKVQEGYVFLKPNDKSAKVIDITPLQSMEGYNLIIEDDGSFILDNGMSSK
jgi:hypothetical protein